jgi:NTP pyrophosphatase (non-canonical NTP hydrolase)
MRFNQYQKTAHETAIYPDQTLKDAVSYLTIALNEEAGEVAGKVKKTLRDHDGIFSGDRRKAIALEMGDLLWYMSELADALGYPLNQIATMNLAKLKDRQERQALQGEGDDR